MINPPLGISQLQRYVDISLRPDLWYWCRRHEQAEQASEERRGLGKAPCILLGPFMSEIEAKRLEGSRFQAPLGMVIET